MERKKILIIDNTALVDKNDRFFVTSSTGNLIKDLLKQGFIIELFQFRSSVIGNDLIHWFPISDMPIRITTVPYSLRLKYLSYLISLKTAIASILRNDFIYFFYPNSFRFLALIAIALHKRIGLNIRGEKRIHDSLSRFLYRRSFVIFTVSPHFTQFAKKYCNFVFNKRPTTEFSLNDIVEKKDFINKKYYQLLFLARLDHDKGILDLLESVKLLNKSESIKFKLLIVGDGNAKNETQMFITNNNLNNVIMYGAVVSKEEIKSLYECSDLYILPSYHEGFPRTLYEAMMFKTPILTTFVGGIDCIMKDNFNCIKIEPHSPTSIAEKIEFALTHRDLMKKITDNATNTCIDYFKQLPYSHGQHLGYILSESQWSKSSDCKHSN